MAYEARLTAFRRVLRGKGQRHLHWNISHSFCSFLYSGVYYDQLKLSVCDAIVSQKGSNGNGKLPFFWQDYNLTRRLWAKINFHKCYSIVTVERIKTPLYEKGTEQNQNSPMETTKTPNEFANTPKSPPKNIKHPNNTLF